MIAFSAESILRPTRAVGILVLVTLLSAGCAGDEERLAEFMERGNAYVQSEESEEAIIEFKNALQIDPNHAAAHEALSLAYIQVGKPREAYWEMTETVRLDPENIDARLRFGTVSLAIGEREVALEQTEAILERDPTRSAAYMLRAQARATAESFDDAEKDYQAAIEHSPDSPAYRFLYAGFLESRERALEAEEQMQKVVELEPSYLAVSNLGRIVARRGNDPELAEKWFKNAVEAALVAPEEAKKNAPGDTSGTTSLLETVVRVDAVSAAYKLLSAFYYSQDRFDDAIAILEEGISKAEAKTDLVYHMARLYRSKGMNEEADALIVRATEVGADTAEPHLILSAFLSQKKDLPGALEAARKAVAAEPENKTARLREAEIRVDIGFHEKDQSEIDIGRKIVDDILAAEPSNPEANFVRAKIQLAEEEFTLALQSLATVLETRPDWAEARFVLGSTLAVNGETKRARSELSRALGTDPTLIQARRLLTQLHSQLGEHEFAIEHGRTYLEQVPGDSEVRIVVAQSMIRVGRPEDAYQEVSLIPEDQRDAGALFALGRLDLAFGRPEQAHTRLLKAYEEAPQNANVLATLLAIDRKAGRLEVSAKRIEEAAELSPKDSKIAELQAEVAAAGGDLDASKAALERAVSLDEANLSAHLALADLERRAGNQDGMLSVLERAAAGSPNSSDLQYRLGLIYEQAGKVDQSIAAYNKAIALNENLGGAKNNLAYLLANEGRDLDRALELAQQAKELMPDDPNSADTLGWVLLKRGVPSAAIGYLEEAVNQLPPNAIETRAIINNHLAEAYEKNNDPEKALRASRAVLENFDKLSKAATERGIDFKEPEWVGEANQRVQRLSSAG